MSATLSFLTFEQWVAANPEVVVETRRVCERCKGRGWNVCLDCDGSGTYECEECGSEVSCRRCVEGKATCQHCLGTGNVNDAAVLYDRQLERDRKALNEYSKLFLAGRAAKCTGREIPDCD